MFDALHELQLEQGLSIIFKLRTGTEEVEIMNKLMLQVFINIEGYFTKYGTPKGIFRTLILSDNLKQV